MSMRNDTGDTPRWSSLPFPASAPPRPLRKTTPILWIAAVTLLSLLTLVQQINNLNHYYRDLNSNGGVGGGVDWEGFAALQPDDSLSTSFSKTNATATSPSSTSPTIPHNLIFTYKTSLEQLQEEAPLLHANVLHTISVYQESWGGDGQVLFLDNAACRSLVQEVEPGLVPYFDVYRGPYKGDICRVCALYKYGGYYFDIDLGVIQPMELDPTVSFVTVRNQRNEFFQAFLATAPQHEILQHNMPQIIKFYDTKRRGDVGPITLRESFDAVVVGSKSNEKNASSSTTVAVDTTLILDEVLLRNTNYSTDTAGDVVTTNDVHHPRHQVVPRQPGAVYILCDYIVHHAAAQQVYFYSRVVGSRGCPQYKPPPVTASLSEASSSEAA